MQAVSPAPDGGYPNGNTAEGLNALFSLTTGALNTALGGAALYFTHDRQLQYRCWLRGCSTGCQIPPRRGCAQYHRLAKTPLELRSLHNTIGRGKHGHRSSRAVATTKRDFNTANGALALYFNTIGERNTAIGDSALYQNTDGNRNTAVGNAALVINTEGNDNTAIGVSALQE